MYKNWKRQLYRFQFFILNNRACNRDISANQNRAPVHTPGMSAGESCPEPAPLKHGKTPTSHIPDSRKYRLSMRLPTDWTNSPKTSSFCPTEVLLSSYVPFLCRSANRSFLSPSLDQLLKPGLIQHRNPQLICFIQLRSGAFSCQNIICLFRHRT